MKCRLCKTRTQVVPGIGNLRSSIFLIGEAPGADEDKQGMPFVGRCGRHLRNLLVKASIEPDQCYITNTVKCRPPGNATPKPEYIQACRKWLWEELKMVKPKVIVTLGAVPAKLLLKHKGALKPIIGVVQDIDLNVIKPKLISCYHPSYLLRKGGSLDDKHIEYFKVVRELAYE